MHSIEYTPIALRDKKAIASYLAFDCNSPQGAINAIASIDGAIETLKTIPQAGRLIDDDRLENAGYRRIVAGQYWIFNRVENERETIVVQRILHQRRDITPQMYYDIDF